MKQDDRIAQRLKVEQQQAKIAAARKKQILAIKRILDSEDGKELINMLREEIVAESFDSDAMVMAQREGIRRMARNILMMGDKL